MTTTQLDPEVVCNYLAALRALLMTLPPSWAAGAATESLAKILVTNAKEAQIDWEYEMDFLQARLAEVERASELAAAERES